MIDDKHKAISHRLKSLAVIGGFLDGQTFELADGINCIIGARGTGKTTVLEFGTKVDIQFYSDARDALLKAIQE